MAKGKADISNTALRIFLQEMGAAYDEERGLSPFGRSKNDFKEVVEFFGNKCCYCDAEFIRVQRRPVQDHLIPMNKSGLGLHAWGNVVSACDPCNSMKHGGDWREFIIRRAGSHAVDRLARVKEFLEHYGYAPSQDLREVAAELYADVGTIAMTLITSKVERIRTKL